MDGNLFSLAFKAFLIAVRPSLLSMLKNIETTFHETSEVPVGKGPLLLRCSILLSRSVVSLINDGNLRASGCKQNSVKADKFSIAVPQQDVISLSGSPVLCVLMFPNATPCLASLFKTHLATSGEVTLFFDSLLFFNSLCIYVYYNTYSNNIPCGAYLIYDHISGWYFKKSMADIAKSYYLKLWSERIKKITWYAETKTCWIL